MRRTIAFPQRRDSHVVLDDSCHATVDEKHPRGTLALIEDIPAQSRAAIHRTRCAARQ